jgi:hypothetical protein
VKPGIVLSLCDRTGIMVQPWLEAGYECWIVDVQHPAGEHRHGKFVCIGADVRDHRLVFPLDTAIVFAFPPCTHLANSGNRYKRDKGLEALYEALGLVIACKRICEASGAPWMIENPIGSLSTYWREPDATFHPWEYTTPKEKKRTCLWAGNNFVIPQRQVFTEPADVQESTWKMPPSVDRGDKRSITPEGFARAVFEANEPWVRVSDGCGIGTGPDGDR